MIRTKNTVRTIPKSNFEIVERDQIDAINAQIHDHSLSWFGTCTSIKSGGVKLDIWSQTSLLSKMMRLCKCFPHMS